MSRAPRIPQVLSRIQSIVAHSYGLSNRDVMLRSEERRDVKILVPRQVAAYLCRKVSPCSLPEIGRAFGQHHTTVLHAISKIQKQIDQDPEFATAVARLRLAIESEIDAPQLSAKKFEHVPAWAARLEAKLDRILGMEK